MELNELYDVDRMYAAQEAIFENMDNYDHYENAKDRYEIFKKSIGEWHFYSRMNDYLRYALREDDINSVISEIQEIKKTRNHELIKNPVSRNTLYREAQQYMVDLDNPGKKVKKYDNETLVLMMCLLHENKYFETFILPDEAFIIADHDNNIEIVGEVYGKYFRFYEYLQGKLSDLKSLPEQKQTQEAISPVKPTVEEKKIPTFRDIFKPEHKEKYDKVIALLANDLPIAVTKVFPELDEAFISITDNKIAWNPSIKYAKSYVAGIFGFCANKYWIDTYTNEFYQEAVSATFDLNLLSPTVIKSVLNKRLNPKFTEPFRLLFKAIE